MRAGILRMQGTYVVSLQLNIVVLFNLLCWYTLDSCEPKDPLLVSCAPPADGATECENAVDCVFAAGHAGSCDHLSNIDIAALASSEIECLALNPPGEWSPPSQGERLLVIHSAKCAPLYCIGCELLTFIGRICASTQARASSPIRQAASARWMDIVKECLPSRTVSRSPSATTFHR